MFFSVQTPGQLKYTQKQDTWSKIRITSTLHCVYQNRIGYLKLQSVTFGALEVSKHNCVHLAEEHCSRSYFSLFRLCLWRITQVLGYSAAVPPVPVPGPAPRGAFAGCAPPNELLCPPTFHPLPSLLNVIDFESESETDKTAHIRTRLHALASVSNCNYTPHPRPTQNVIWNSNAPLMEVPWRRLWPVWI